MKRLVKFTAEPSGTRHFSQIYDDRYLIDLYLGTRRNPRTPPLFGQTSSPHTVVRLPAIRIGQSFFGPNRAQKNQPQNGPSQRPRSRHPQQAHRRQGSAAAARECHHRLVSAAARAAPTAPEMSCRRRQGSADSTRDELPPPPGQRCRRKGSDATIDRGPSVSSLPPRRTPASAA
jgi:hypothetical protein